VNAVIKAATLQYCH